MTKRKMLAVGIIILLAAAIIFSAEQLVDRQPAADPPTTDEEVFFVAEIIDAQKDYLLVEIADEGTTSYVVGAKFEVSTETVSADGCPEFAAGEYARVLIERDVVEEPPGRIAALAIWKTDASGKSTAD